MSWAAVGISAVSMGVSLYGSSKSAAQQREAASNNAYLSRLQAASTAAVTRYQAKLNYQTAMTQSAMQHQNATVLHNAAGVIVKNGDEQIQRMYAQEKRDASEITAAYASSGVQSDSGSAQVVQGYNASMNQLKRMDTLYGINTAAADKDWQGVMSDYQSQLTAETAQQFKYAEQMADWNEKMGIASAGVQQSVANANADATQIQGYSNAIGSLASGYSSYAEQKYRSSLTPRNNRLGSGGAID